MKKLGFSRIAANSIENNDVAEPGTMNLVVSPYFPTEFKYQKGPGFVWSDLTREIKGTFGYPIKSYYSVPSTLWSLSYLILNCFFYALLTWYCDHVFPNNRGNTDSALFFLSTNFWRDCFSRKKRRRFSQESNKHQPFDYNNMKFQDTVEVEKQRVLNNAVLKTEVGGLRITRLGKVYNRYPFGIKSRKDVEALKEIYLEVDDGELLGVLGHNGAGKSTMIGVLTGIYEPTTGTAEICNYDIRYDMQEIRSIMGVCPQFDILWDELTAEEHLEMFCQLKNIDSHRVEEEIDYKLKQVDLSHVKKCLVSTFSGGMKRRMSLAISCIGNPKIIFLDEPTTGMDPKTRRQIWKMIQELKKNRVLILTTHGMDEADALSDRIAVIVGGRMKCIGTPLYLKNAYGDGYRLTLVVEPRDIDEVKSVLREMFAYKPKDGENTQDLQGLKGIKLLDESGGSLIALIPLIMLGELNLFFKIMENKIVDQKYVKFKNSIKDWGLSHATLEEVFMKITNANKKI